LSEQGQAPATETELEALIALLQSPGWRLFSEHVKAEHGAERCIAQIDAALSTVQRGDDAAARDTVAQIRSASRAALLLASWPLERVKALRAAAVPQQGGRAEFHRRGGL
jgi:hypothetical protein